MIFIYQKWDDFCRHLKDKGIISIPACDVTKKTGAYLVFKHDIENTVPRAFELAKIEHKYGHRGSYYAHAYLLDNPQNVELLCKMQEMGHEISYHYDVMDSNHGNLDNAIDEFAANKNRFEELGFKLITVCQHGNPIVERVGYTSNRDFFRHPTVQKLYPEISDIMVDFKQKHNTDYIYYSDAGRQFKMVFDPINNDVVNSDNKNIAYEDLDALLEVITTETATIISTHPHRWTRSAATYLLKEKTFNVIKSTAKALMKVPVFKRIMSKYYYLARKI